MRTCELDGCDNKHKRHGFCNKHSLRMKRNGDPHKVYRDYNGINPTYRTLHKRLADRYGKASNYECSICGGPAQEWAVVREWMSEEDTLKEVNDKNSYTYSRCDWDYTTLCIPHHRQYDFGTLNLDEWLVS